MSSFCPPDLQRQQPEVFGLAQNPPSTQFFELMPPAPATHAAPVEAFIERWQKAEAAERANYQMFLAELCDLIDAPHPDPAGADSTNILKYRIL